MLGAFNKALDDAAALRKADAKAADKGEAADPPGAGNRPDSAGTSPESASPAAVAGEPPTAR